MKKSAALLAVAVLAVLATIVPTAQAATTAASCAASAGVTLSPGISMKPTSGTFASVAGGTMACAGVVKGIKVGGTGTLKFSGSYGPGDTCASGHGKGSLAAGLRKVGGGTMSVTGSFSFTRAGSIVNITGTLGGASLHAAFQFSPKPGQDCVKTKVTKATVTGSAVAAG